MEDSADAERQCDAYALWSAVTALTQEIKLQGRSFGELRDTVAMQPGKIAEELRALYAERERTLQREVERRCRREALGVLIDLRDRLGRGRESLGSRESKPTAAVPSNWFARLFRKPANKPEADPVDALVRGYDLGIERLDQALDESNAREIRCLGESFDPRRMNAIDTEESETVAAGTVLEVYRSGYEWNDEIFRPAQVKVSR